MERLETHIETSLTDLAVHWQDGGSLLCDCVLCDMALVGRREQRVTGWRGVGRSGIALPVAAKP